MVYGAEGCAASGMHVGWGLLKVVWFVVAAFVFSLIFWGTHNWLASKKKRRR